MMLVSRPASPAPLVCHDQWHYLSFSPDKDWLACNYLVLKRTVTFERCDRNGVVESGVLLKTAPCRVIYMENNIDRRQND